MKNWSIQRRVLLIALLPAALIALALSAWHARSRVAELEAATLDHARSLVRQFAPLSEPGVRTDDRARLQFIARSALAEDRAIAGVSVTGADGELLARVPFDAPGELDPSAPPLVRIDQPIARAALAGPGGSAIDPAATGAGDIIGRFAVTVDLSAVRALQAAVLVESLGITALALILTALLSARIGRTVTEPVQSLTRTLDRLRAGDLAARPSLCSGGELGMLERGVNDLACEVEHTQASLHERVDCATRELQAALAQLEDRNAQLEAARGEAEAASEFKSHFLASISHEIRTPMNSILGFTELLAEGDHDPVHADYLATIRDSARSLLDLLNGILDLSKMESGRMELEYGDADVNRLLAELFQLLAPQAFEKGVEFIVVPVAPAYARVHTDPLRLKQVLVNLASNAVKFTDAGHVRVSAAPTPRADGAIAMRFCIEDTGRGIDASAQTRLFQAFAQGRRPDEASDPSSTGTGLGLHIASEIVFLMDGLIEFRSEAGSGSAFWFTLELAPARQHPPRPSSPPPRRRVLLIDDEESTRVPHMEQMALAGVDAEHAPADHAPRRLPGSYDAVILHVPAREALKASISSPDPRLRRSGVPVIALVHAHGTRVRELLQRAGHSRCVSKTADPAAFRRAFEEAIASGPDTAAPVPADTTRPSAQRAVAPASTGRRVLLVDDHPVNLKLMTNYLAAAGFDACTATRSDEALYRAALEPFAVIVADIHLPRRDGIATAEILRAGDGPNAATPIVAITADACADQARRAMRAGIDDVLVKPVSRETVIARMARWCPAEGVGESVTDTARPMLDGAEGIRRAAGSPDVARELFEILCRNLPESRDALARARARGDSKAALAEAHRLRGAVAYCGVPRLEAAVTGLEQAARGGGPAELETALTRLERSIDELLAHARSHRRSTVLAPAGSGSAPATPERRAGVDTDGAVGPSQV